MTLDLNDPGTWPAPRPFGEPGSTNIQWKGTRVCVDLICLCGEDQHYDADYALAFRCRACGRVLRLGHAVAVVEDPDYDRYAVDSVFEAD